MPGCRPHRPYIERSLISLLDQISFNTAPGPHHEPDDPGLSVADPLVRLIAFYLPQFHAIPENDAWWGKGFTEWTNVSKAVPRFAGHYQPRLPADFGFYDLAHVDALRAQAALARRYGVAGFCFHHYWFTGRRLLQRPLDLLLANRDIDLPFCVNWANEPWSRRWDGKESAVLMPQHHSPEDDAAFARSLEPLMRDERYIRVGDRPLLLLYRPALLPDAAATVGRWREHLVAAGLGNPFVLMAQVFGDTDWRRYGMDGAAGFPPFWTPGPNRDDLELFDPRFRGDVADYETMARATAASWGATDRLFPGVCPAWDNEARKPGRGYCFTGSTPAKYGRFLQAACHTAVRRFPPGERLVFVNAWNEWAEGAYLEPDRHFGHAYLAETARVLANLPATAAEGGETGDAPLPRRPTIRPTLKARTRRAARRTLDRMADAAEEIGWRLRNFPSR